MLRVLENVMLHHDVRLVLLAAVICAFGAFCTVNVSGVLPLATHDAVLVLLSVCAGATVWRRTSLRCSRIIRGLSTTYDPDGAVIRRLGHNRPAKP